MFPQSLICSLGYEMRRFYESETLITPEFYGCKDSNFNKDCELIQSIVCILPEFQCYFESKPVKSWN